MNTQLLKLTFVLLLLFPIFAGAQQVHVLSEAVEFSGKIGSSQRKTVLLHNESSQPKTFLLRNIKGSIGSSQKMRICLGDQCFDPKKDLAKVMLKLAPGEIYTDLYLEFELGIAETLGSFDLVFVNRFGVVWVSVNWRLVEAVISDGGSNSGDILSLSMDVVLDCWDSIVLDNRGSMMAIRLTPEVG